MIDKDKIKRAVRDIIEAIGDDPDRSGLFETPDRVANMYEEIFAGMYIKPESLLKTFYEDKHQEMIIVKDIPLYSICEHHLLPFIGIAHVCYIPREGKILGLSKIARVVDILSKKPQLQERLTSEIADVINKELHPIGIAVIVEAEHLCMTMRGIKKAGSKTTTSALRGNIKTDSKTRSEVLLLLKG
jgi:GTP cyclohydrolase I